ncbi:hypothetical protein [Burkholderia orbicola]|uniref:hypothetical protein n=1 Tax=Burkholderia orbicola TaxID=2978683 RepID=UPI002FE1C19A
MDEFNSEYSAFAAEFMDELARNQRRALLGIKLQDLTKAQLEWELASAQALTNAYQIALGEALQRKAASDHLTDQMLEILQKAPELIRSRDARERANARHASSTSATSKDLAKQWFDRWTADPSLHATKEDFIRCFLDAHPDSIKDGTLRKWLSAWARDLTRAPWD